MERCEELESSTMIELFIYTVIAGPSFYSSYQVRVLVMYRDFS